jgi:hypothetical protein
MDGPPFRLRGLVFGMNDMSRFDAVSPKAQSFGMHTQEGAKLNCSYKNVSQIRRQVLLLFRRKDDHAALSTEAAFGRLSNSASLSFASNRTRYVTLDFPEAT